MKLSKGIASKLLRLCKGEKVPASKLKHPLVIELLQDGLIADSRSGRSKSMLYVPQPESMRAFLQSRFSIADLESYVDVLQAKELSRSQLVQAATDSKAKRVRTFQGFLVNSYEPVKATMNDMSFLVSPAQGTFMFIHAFKRFVPPPDVTIVGIENPENFSRVERQRHLFHNLNPLFVSRYPQQQSKDLIKWLQGIQNPYLHFGDFDFAGIGIYLHEYKRYLGARASWFIPDNLEPMLQQWGNRELYDVQKINFDGSQIEEPGIQKTIELLHHYKKGLEQEALIMSD